MSKSLLAASAVLIAWAMPAFADMPRMTTDDGLRAFIEGLRSGEYDPNDVHSGVARWIDKNSGKVQGWLDEAGAIKTIYFVATDERRRSDIYVVQFEDRWGVWLLARSTRNKIRMFRYRSF